MPSSPEYKPVRDEDVPMEDDAIAVGADLEFQRRWWRFERYIWIFFSLILIADLSGLLGRGPLAKAERRTADGSLDVKYERVERANTPSIVTIIPGKGTVRDGKLQLFVSEDLVKGLGAQRVVPQPEVSSLGQGGITYTFAASALPMTVQIALEPSFIGLHRFQIAVPGDDAVHAKAFVLP